MNTRVKASVQKLESYTPGEQPRRAGLIKLNTNENPYPPSARVVDCLANVDPLQLRLYPDPVCTELRDAVGALHGVAREQVFAGNGSDEILALCTKAFVEDRGTIGFFTPSYSLYPVLAAIRDVPGVACELDESFGWPAQDPLPASLFFLANPNAPTSLLFAKERVAAFCRSFPGVVLIDEAYVDFAEENCMDLAREQPNVLVLRTLSKSYSLAGIRCGYVVGAPDLIHALFKIKDSYNLDRLTQQLATAAVRDQDAMRENARRIKATRARAAGELSRRGFAVAASATNFLWVRPATVPARTLFEALRERGILVRHFPGARTGEYLRITIGTDAEIDRLLSMLGELT